MEKRACPVQFETRESDGKKEIVGYFSVFDSIYKMFEGCTESVAKGAFRESLENNDIRALINHDTTLVLGRNKNNTLTLKEDDKGLWGSIKINEQDLDAMNLYHRVQRGDVDQCSIGFEILDEDREQREENEQFMVHFTLKRVNLFEVSVVTFPAYEETSVKARQSQMNALNEEREAEYIQQYRKEKLKELRGE